MQRVSVAVIGSGPAGAACALRLVRDGFSVALVEERAFPRPKLCGEYLNGGAVRELEDLGFDAMLSAESTPLQGMRLIAHGAVAEFPFSTRSGSVAREILDERIRSAAIDAGAIPIAGRLHGVVAADSGVVVTIAQKSGEPLAVFARYLVGADGLRSSVARLCKLDGPVPDGRFAIGGHYAGLELSRWIEMYASDGGYLAINPLDERSANAVFVLSKAHVMRARDDIGAELARFSLEATDGKRHVNGDRLQGERHSIGPISQRTSRIAAKNVLLVGDAAAFVDPFTGQGVYLALAGARRAAAAIAGALNAPSRERAAWNGYAAQTRDAITERRRLAFMVKMLVTFGFASRRAARALRRRPADFAPLVEAVCGNRTAPAEPLLALEIARALR